MILELGATMRLATYGTLAPGKPNHHQVSALRGRWLKGTVRGKLINEGRGAVLGYPGLILDEHGSEIQVDLFESPELPAHWERLDVFEGPGYRRTEVRVLTSEGPLNAQIYVLSQNVVLDPDI